MLATTHATPIVVFTAVDDVLWSVSNDKICVWDVEVMQRSS
jgi:hypothetical protein